MRFAVVSITGVPRIPVGVTLPHIHPLACGVPRCLLHKVAPSAWLIAYTVLLSVAV
jgi:hypothetical protein